jgi:hypothetical protein
LRKKIRRKKKSDLFSEKFELPLNKELVELVKHVADEKNIATTEYIRGIIVKDLQEKKVIRKRD